MRRQRRRAGVRASPDNGRANDGARRGCSTTTCRDDPLSGTLLLGQPRAFRHGRPSSAPDVHRSGRDGGLGATRCETPRQTCLQPNGFKRNLRSKTRWFTGFCNSHQVSHFATFFIDARAEISVAESRVFVKEAFVPSTHPQDGAAGDSIFINFPWHNSCRGSLFCRDRARYEHVRALRHTGRLGLFSQVRWSFCRCRLQQ